MSGFFKELPLIGTSRWYDSERLSENREIRGFLERKIRPEVAERSRSKEIIGKSQLVRCDVFSHIRMWIVLWIVNKRRL